MEGEKLAPVALYIGIAATALGALTLVLSFIPIIGLCTCLTGPVGFLCALAGIVIGIIALVGDPGSKKMQAIWGIILSALFFAFGIIQLVLSIVIGIGRSMF